MNAEHGSWVVMTDGIRCEHCQGLRDEVADRPCSARRLRATLVTALLIAYSAIIPIWLLYCVWWYFIRIH
jgi:hypothetical protein